MSRRAILACLSAFALAASGSVVLAAGASAIQAGGPWPDGTVFAAASGQRHGDDGALVAIEPDGTVQTIAAGTTPNDVAVAPDGTVYWTDCDNAGLFSYAPGGSVQHLVYDANCASAVAVEPSGDVLVGDIGAITRYASDGTQLGTVYSTSNGYAAFSIAVDPADDIYFTDTYGRLEVLPAGADDATAVNGVDGGAQLRSVRLGPDSQLMSATYFGYGIDEFHLDGSADSTHDTGYTSRGAVMTQDGDIYASDLVNDPDTQDRVDVISGGSMTPGTSGLDTPEGLAVFPPVTPAPRTGTTTTVTTSNPTTTQSYRQTTITAHVSGADSGNVVFSSNGQPLSNIVPVTHGVARLTRQLPYGSDAITATYLGSATTYPSTSAPLPFTVSATVTHTSLATTSPTSVADGTQVAVTATVTGRGGPGGYVKFYLDGAFVESDLLDDNGQATLSLNLSGTNPKVRAVYQGTEVFKASQSNTLSFTTTPPYHLTSIGVTESNGPVWRNGSERVTTTVTLKGYYAVARPSGTVSADHGFTCGALTAGAASNVSVTQCTAVLPAGAGFYVTVDYDGGTNYGPATAVVYASVD